jgi:hypothetical protein
VNELPCDRHPDYPYLCGRVDALEERVKQVEAACRTSLRIVNVRLWQRGAELTPAELSAWKTELEAAIKAAPHNVLTGENDSRRTR